MQEPVLDWGKLAPLRLRARVLADGLFAGGHRSVRRGAGIEFGGYRSYVPGDDLRFLDRRALVRHGKLLVREFETETDRSVSLILDASASMGFRGATAPASKLAWVGLLAAALTRIAVHAGDAVALDWVGGAGGPRLGAASGREAFERVVAALESCRAGGDLVAEPGLLTQALAPVARRARRGALIVLFSDLLDLPEDALEAVMALGARGRELLVVRVLDPEEARFPYEGPLRLRSLEGDVITETDAAAARDAYLAALADIGETWRARVLARAGRWVDLVTDEEPLSALQRLLESSS